MTGVFLLVLYHFTKKELSMFKMNETRKEEKNMISLTTYCKIYSKIFSKRKTKSREWPSKSFLHGRISKISELKRNT